MLPPEWVEVIFGSRLEKYSLMQKIIKLNPVFARFGLLTQKLIIDNPIHCLVTEEDRLRCAEQLKKFSALEKLILRAPVLGGPECGEKELFNEVEWGLASVMYKEICSRDDRSDYPIPWAKRIVNVGYVANQKVEHGIFVGSEDDLNDSFFESLAGWHSYDPVCFFCSRNPLDDIRLTTSSKYEAFVRCITIYSLSSFAPDRTMLENASRFLSLPETCNVSMCIAFNHESGFPILDVGYEMFLASVTENRKMRVTSVSFMIYHKAMIMLYDAVSDKKFGLVLPNQNLQGIDQFAANLVRLLPAVDKVSINIFELQQFHFPRDLGESIERAVACSKSNLRITLSTKRL
jgi:hypothetical protein